MRQRLWITACLTETLLMTAAGCTALPTAIESHALTGTDLEVIRVAVKSAVETAARPNRAIVVSMETLIVPIWQAPRPSFPPVSPPPFNSGRGHAAVPPPLSVDDELLTPDERAAWEIRNKVSMVLRDLGVAGWAMRHAAAHSPTETVVAVSAPCYGTKDSAVLYLRWTCGGTCGEGRLIRLRREGASWRVTASQRLSIS
jgi:hypothetical protein